MEKDHSRVRLLSKSRFKLALECITRLYYVGKKEEYADESLDDPFLKALADGGFQVGELAKYMFCEDPVGENITVDTLNYDEALQQTNEKLSLSGKVVIAEGAFKHNNLFIRADIIVKDGNRFDLYEVKAKSIDGEDEAEDESSFISYLGRPNEKVKSKWAPYIYDLAFQKHVIVQSMPGYEVHAHLLLVDKAAVATVEGLNQKFKIIKEGSRSRVEPEPGLKASHLGKSILRAVKLDDLIDKVWNKYKVPTDLPADLNFESFVNLCEETYLQDERKFAPIGSKCKGCQFKSSDSELKSGFSECWKHHTGYSDELLSKPLVLELWGGGVGGRSITQELINFNVFLMEQVEESLFVSENGKKESESIGMSSLERRMKQVSKIRDKDVSSEFLLDQFNEEKAQWIWPLNMIDFETSTVALPFHKGTKPYQGIAFQFSHHIMNKDGSILHANQFIHFEKGVYPNIEFIRALKESLSINDGTIFRYHNHENTYLRMIHRQLEAGMGNVVAKERAELMEFIDTITQHKPEGDKHVKGFRNMVDLYDITKRLYYSPHTKGSISLKKVLPAIILDSNFLKEKYGVKGVYGKELLMQSLNFEDHVWITKETAMDPYKTLPSVFNDYDKETLDNLVKDMDGLADGGSALTAYGYLQYSNLPADQKVKIKEGLLRYCELDTLAMVMLMEGWMNWK